MPLGIYLPAQLNDLAVDVAVGSPARGAVFYRGASQWNALPVGTSGQYLQTSGPGADPVWATFPTTLLGDVTLAPNAPARNLVQSTADANPALILKAFSQTADVHLQEWQDSLGAVIGYVSVPGVAALTIQPTLTQLSGSHEAVHAAPVSSPASSSAANFRGFVVDMFTDATSVPYTGSVSGFKIGASHFGSGTINSLSGGTLAANTVGGGTITTLNGLLVSYSVATVAASVGTALGISSMAIVGPTGASIGQSTELLAAAPSITAGATITTQEGVRIDNQGAAAVTTSYALHISAQASAATTWAIVSEGGQSLLKAAVATQVPLAIQGFTSQSANLFNIQDVAAGLLLDVTSAGNIELRRKDSTTEGSLVGTITGAFNSNTHASYTGRITISATDASGTREVFRGEGTGSAGALSFFGAAAVVQQATASTAGIAGIRTDTLANAVTDIRVILTALRAWGTAYGLTANTA